jgi:hypothetical protein
VTHSKRPGNSIIFSIFPNIRRCLVNRAKYIDGMANIEGHSIENMTNFGD